MRVFLNEAVSAPLAQVVIRANESLLLTARFGMRQAVAALAHVARPAAFCLMRCSRTLGVRSLPPPLSPYNHAAGRP